MRYLDIYEMTELKRAKRDGHTSIYNIEVAGIQLPTQVLIRKMETHYRAEVGTGLRYVGGQWAFDHIFAFWTNFGGGQPATFRFGFEDEGKQALRMDKVFQSVSEAQRGIKDWLMDEGGMAHLQERSLLVAQVRAAETKRLLASAELYGKMNSFMHGEVNQ